jgi:predicted membrane-bound spermidine synthase
VPRLIVAGLLLAEAIVAFAALAFEISVARLVAPHVGMSTDTWTAIIAAFLGAWAIGNHLGGRLAAAPARRIGPPAAAALALAALAVALAPGLVALGDRWIVAPAPQETWRIVLLAALPCLPAGLLLGITSPLLMTALIRATRGSGLVIGLAAATGAGFSALGALAALWVLLDWLGTRGTCTALAALALLGAVLLAALSGRIGPAAAERPA